MKTETPFEDMTTDKMEVHLIEEHYYIADDVAHWSQEGMTARHDRRHRENADHQHGVTPEQMRIRMMKHVLILGVFGAITELAVVAVLHGGEAMLLTFAFGHICFSLGFAVRRILEDLGIIGSEPHHGYTVQRVTDLEAMLIQERDERVMTKKELEELQKEHEALLEDYRDYIERYPKL